MEKEEKLAKFGPGPWMDEPDRVEWRAGGVPCLMVRNPSGGHWCGYAAAPPGHPWHGKDGDFADHVLGDLPHGGITYANACGGLICHVPQPGEPDHVWWFGFDCAHAGDTSPGYRLGEYDRGRFRWEQYRSAEYVRQETEKLARQIRDAAIGYDANGSEVA